MNIFAFSNFVLLEMHCTCESTVAEDLKINTDSFKAGEKIRTPPSCEEVRRTCGLVWAANSLERSLSPDWRMAEGPKYVSYYVITYYYGMDVK